MTRIWLRLSAGIYLIMYFFLSISTQLCCKIKLFPFWVQLNARHTCVIVANIYWPYLFKDSTNNCASSRIVVFSNFPKPGFIGPVPSIIPSTKLVTVTLCISHMTMLWFPNDFSGWVIDRVNNELLSNYSYFLVVIYFTFSTTVTIPGCVLFNVLYVVS